MLFSFFITLKPLTLRIITPYISVGRSFPACLFYGFAITTTAFSWQWGKVFKSITWKDLFFGRVVSEIRVHPEEFRARGHHITHGKVWQYESGTRYSHRAYFRSHAKIERVWVITWTDVIDGRAIGQQSTCPIVEDPLSSIRAFAAVNEHLNVVELRKKLGFTSLIDTPYYGA